jgi:hypothetical protein
MQVLFGLIVIAILIWLFASFLHLIGHLLYVIVSWPFQIFGDVFFSPITWWSIAGIFLISLLFGMGPRVRNITLGVYVCGALVMWLVLHAIPNADAKTKIVLATIWPYAMYDMIAHPMSADKARCLQEFDQNVCQYVE